MLGSWSGRLATTKGTFPRGWPRWSRGGAEAISGGGPMAALAMIQDIADPGERQQALVEMIGQLDAAGVAGFLEQLITVGKDSDQGFDDGWGMMALFCLTDRLVQLDQEEAASIALRLMEGGAEDSDMDMSEEIVSILVTAFVAQRDVGRARDLYAEMKLANPDLGDEFLSIIYVGSALDDPAAALRRYLEEGGDDGSDIDPVFELAGSRVGETLDGVLAVEASELRLDLIGRLFDAWAESDPHEALNRALELSEDNSRETTWRPPSPGRRPSRRLRCAIRSWSRWRRTKSKACPDVVDRVKLRK